MNAATFDALIKWFKKEREDHFFRRNRTPYRVWISEVALQQTRIGAAVETLKSFLKTFPHIEDLADSTEEEVLQAWQGLGYYSRARNLRKGAQLVCDKYQGKLPASYSELKKIPSIGPYTAAALGSICFDLSLPAVDGNLRRVLARTERWALPPASSKLTRKTREHLENLFLKSPHSPGDLNEALMELGQKICLPTNPQCLSCPISQWCGAYDKGEVEQYPARAPKKERVEVKWNAYILENEKGEVLLQKWKDFYFLKGQWSFPSRLYFPKKEEKILSWTGSDFEDSQLSSLPSLRHGITKHKIEITPCLISPQDSSPLPLDSPSFQWIPREKLSDKLVASALLKIWKKVEEERKKLEKSLFDPRNLK